MIPVTVDTLRVIIRLVNGPDGPSYDASSFAANVTLPIRDAGGKPWQYLKKRLDHAHKLEGNR